MAFKVNNIKWGFLVFLLLLNIIIWSEIISFGLRDDLKLVFLDVGQGDAIFVETKSGNQVLIDGGANDKVLRELSGLMSFFDKSIDIIIATHPDSDHIGGLVGVLDRFRSKIFLESGSKSQTLIYESLEDALNKNKTKRIIVRRGMVFDLGDDVFLKILFPDRDVSGLDPNTASIIVKIEHKDISFLLTGDSPKSIENYLVSVDGKNLKSDVLKAGHHGSKTSTSLSFLEFASPIYSIISAGEGNRYKHPHQEVIDRLNDFGTDIYETSKLGSIVFSSDGKNIEVK